MNLASLVVVFLRLMALNFVLNSITHLLPFILRFRQEGPDLDLDSLRPSIILIVIQLAGAALIWLYATTIAHFVTKETSLTVSIGTLTLTDAYSLLFAGMGLFFIARHLSVVLTWIHYLLKRPQFDRSFEPNIGYDMTNAVVPFLVGLVLFLNSRKFAILLARNHQRQTALTDPA